MSVNTSSTPSNEEVKTPLLSSNVYDKLKFLAQILLPAIGTLYFALADLWELPKAQEVVGSIVALDVFLGALLSIAAKQYNDIPPSYDGFLDSKGEDPDTGIPHLALTVTTPPEELLAGDVVTLKVGPPNE